MQILCDSHEIKQCFETEEALTRAFGRECAKILKLRISQIRAARSFQELSRLPNWRLLESPVREGAYEVPVGKHAILVIAPIQNTSSEDSRENSRLKSGDVLLIELKMTSNTRPNLVTT